MFYANLVRKQRNSKGWLIALVILCLPILNISYALISRADSGDQVILPAKAQTESNSLTIKSVDTQIISKHWGEIDKDNVSEQINLIKSLNANYIAISTPYDDPAVMKEWAEAIHQAGLHVWFRSHWLNWEGDENHPSNMTIKEYLDRTENFIKANQSLFKSGDALTVCVEPEQVFTARGTDVYDWYSYNKFVIDQIDVASRAFSDIGLDGEIYTNWISMNGWVVQNALEKETVEKMGLITVDHYPDQKTILPAETAAQNLSNDLDKIYQKWQKPIILGEWGYNIEQEVTDFDQKEVLNKTFEQLSTKKYLIGLNYWAHMGNTSRLISDKDGKNLILRPAAVELQNFYR